MHESSSPTRVQAPRASAIAGRGFCIFLALLALVGCDEAVVEVKSTTGVIEVTALTAGSGPYPDSFNVILNGGRLGSVVPNGVFSIPILTRGDYQVALLEEADNCWYGVNARIVTVVPNDTSFTTFLVRCK
jgi:hypothetical protein